MNHVMLMLWIKAFHIIAMVTWLSGLFYLPRLFVYHAMTTDLVGIERFNLMERRLYYGITTPGAWLTLGLGGWLLYFNWPDMIKQPWMHLKLSCVVLLVLYHGYLGMLRRSFAANQNKHHATFYRILNEIPIILLSIIIIAVIIKPFSY